jgi:hypothetical protein
LYKKRFTHYFGDAQEDKYCFKDYINFFKSDEAMEKTYYLGYEKFADQLDEVNEKP